MAGDLGIKKFVLINDFVAIGYSLTALKEVDVIHVNPDVKPVHAAPIACLGAGTGLGQVYLTHSKKHYDVWPSEGGHADFPARTQLEFDLMKFIQENEQVDRVSVERVVSGLAMPRIYDFLASRSPSLVKEETTLAMSQQDRAAIITQWGLKKKDLLCEQALDMFVSLYGSEAGNLAIKTLCFGGLYVAGGIGPRILPNAHYQDIFYKSMLAKGRMRTVLNSVPVYVVMHPGVGLLGAQVMGLRLLEDLDFKVNDDAICDTEKLGAKL